MKRKWNSVIIFKFFVFKYTISQLIWFNITFLLPLSFIYDD